MAWSLELSYGTPYLLSLGLSPQVTSLVWLAGPLSGLIAQPVVGCLSDASNSKFRRRYYMLVSTLFILLSTLALAFAQPVSEALVDLFALGLGDWDPVREARVGTATRTLAVISFWILDFALNGLQASGRALVLDRLNGEEMDSGNAWLGRSESDEGSPRCHR
jgi:solute carrier family 45 protein 1/2/4